MKWDIGGNDELEKKSKKERKYTIALTCIFAVVAIVINIAVFGGMIWFAIWLWHYYAR